MTAPGCCTWSSPSPSAPVLCCFCGEPEVVELFEIWGHEFMWETCCPSLHESLCQQVADDPAWGRELLRRIGAEAFTGHQLRRLADDDVGSLVLDWQLRVQPIAFRAACAFVRAHHTHCGPPVTARFSLSALNGATLLGVAMTGNPVARAFMGRGIVEVNRLCVRRDVPAALRWNAASLLLGRAAREAEHRGFQRIVTYIRSDEAGTSLRAAGWVPESTVRGRSWHSARRSRSNTNAHIDKVRWSRTLRPKQERPASCRKEASTALPDWLRPDRGVPGGLGLDLGVPVPGGLNPAARSRP